MVEYAESWANSGKLVVIAALDGTWQRQPFHSILQLIPLAEDVCKLKAVCSTCQQDAAFTKRLTKEIELQVGLKAALLICKLGYSLQWFGVCAASGQPLLQCPQHQCAALVLTAAPQDRVQCNSQIAPSRCR